MENKTVIARAMVPKIQRKAKASESKKRARKEGKFVKKAATQTPKVAPPLANQQIVLADRGKGIEINTHAVNLIVEEQPPVTKGSQTLRDHDTMSHQTELQEGYLILPQCRTSC